MERRREVRERANGRFSASYSDGASRFGITIMDVVDRSSRGLGVFTRAQIEPGMIVTLSHEATGVPGLRAIAVRAERVGDRCRVGLEFGNRIAA